MAKKIFLDESEIPRQWYNIMADIKMNPPIRPDGSPLEPGDLAPVFPMNLIEQEVSTERWIDIPDEVLEKYLIWRPTPLVPGRGPGEGPRHAGQDLLQERGRQPSGEPQAEYGGRPGLLQQGVRHQEDLHRDRGRAVGECPRLCLHPVRPRAQGLHGEDQLPAEAVSADHDGDLGRQVCGQPQRGDRSRARAVLAKDPDSPGSLGIAISEAIEMAVGPEDTRYSLGSVLNHVLLHQTIIGLEAKKQMEKIGEYPDVVIGCAGGGSNFAGLAFPFVHDKINGKEIKILSRGTQGLSYPDERSVCVRSRGHRQVHAADRHAQPWPHLRASSDSCGRPSVSRHGAPGQPARLGRHSGASFVPPAGKLRGGDAVGPNGRVTSRAPETNQALACVVDEAKKAKEEGKEKVILVNWSGHGLIDLGSYERYLSKQLVDYELPDEMLEKAEEVFKDFPKPALLKSR